MAKKKPEDKFTKRRLRTSYVTSVISISLVLFILGSLGMIILHSQKLSVQLKENFRVDIYLKSSAKEADIVRFKKTLDLRDAIKRAHYISTEEAAESFQEDLGEDFIKFLDGKNPLPASIEVYLTESYANVDSLRVFSEEIMENKIVEEVQYHESYIKKINENIAKISFFFLLFGGAMMLISIALINNTIRLSVYSQRFNIRTMQLIGATQRFIRRPFIKQGVIQGFVSAILAIAMIVAVLYRLKDEIPDIVTLDYLELYLLLLAGIIVLGILISWISSFFAVRKYLKIKLDNLYYF